MKIPRKIRDAVTERFEARTFPKKHTLLEQGEVSYQAYFVDTGCLRMWHNDDGNDISVKFFLPGDMVSSFESFYREEPSLFGIETILPTKLRIIKKQYFLEQMESSAEFQKQILGIAVACMADYQNLFLNQITGNAEDRFRLLMRHDPRLLECVPQHYIASYLGVTPVTLSRLRKKLSALTNDNAALSAPG